MNVISNATNAVADLAQQTVVESSAAAHRTETAASNHLQPETGMPADTAAEIAHREHRLMVATGEMWQEIAETRPFDPQKPIKRLAEENIRALRAKTGTLSSDERRFYVNLMRQPWYLTFFTSAHRLMGSMLREDGRVHLESYEQRRKRGDNFTNAAQADLDVFAGGNFVYFCLEIGRSLKKRSTRSRISGNPIIVRVPMHRSPIEHGMSLHADIFDGLRAERRLRIPEHERNAINQHLARFADEPLNDDNGFARTVFYGHDAIREGTALQVLLDARRLSEATRADVLRREGSGELNNIISSLSRTQVMIPERCSLDKYTLHSIGPSPQN